LLLLGNGCCVVEKEMDIQPVALSVLGSVTIKKPPTL
jgi:hypothetical protein